MSLAGLQRTQKRPAGSAWCIVPSNEGGTSLGSAPLRAHPPHSLCRLEVDLILGTWATRFVPSLPLSELDQYEQVLKLETVDVYNWITGREPVPEVRCLGQSLWSVDVFGRRSTTRPCSGRYASLQPPLPSARLTLPNMLRSRRPCRIELNHHHQ
jgi:hypothetical protein